MKMSITSPSELTAELLVQSVTDYAIYMLDPDGWITSWNAGAARFKGYDAGEIIGRHFSTFYTESDVVSGLPARALRTAIEENRFEAEGWRVRKDGTHFWASVVIDPIRNSEGELIGFAKITRDLTERRDAQLALEQSQEAFFHSQRFEAIGRLTGGVAHDFNNLLSAILGSISLAEKRLTKGEDVSRFLLNAKEAAQRGAMLTQRMLSFARKQDLKFVAVDLATCIAGMTDLFRHTAGPDVSIAFSIAPDLPSVRADPAQLELAMLNLIVNARDAMPGGGAIVIKAGRGSEADAGFVSLAVEDDGSGMDDETVARAIEPFFTTKGVGKGTGLGLSMVQGMADQSGGRFEIQSRAGAGTRALIWLAVADGEPVRTETDGNTTAEENEFPVPLHILVVDDDAIVLMNTVLVLEDEGHMVLQAASGSQALAILESEPVDVIVTDFAMPEMNGAELIEKAMVLRPEVPAIVLSGYVDLPSGWTLNVPQLSKPCDEHELIAAIAAVRGK